MEERNLGKIEVVGSIPTEGSVDGSGVGFLSLVVSQNVAGSIPVVHPWRDVGLEAAII